MKYDIQRTSQFKKDFKLAKKRGLNISKLIEVITILSNGETLPKEYLEHPLKGNYNNCLECHIDPDWLLIYKIDNELMILSLRRTGSHSDLF
ncbi:MAG: type II toxin-antitoxin system YafQ family toxin [Clostridia bacterium]|nr:type II toxin-antitoxin system YafQ family toxin [Clostridia bacterium]